MTRWLRLLPLLILAGCAQLPSLPFFAPPAEEALAEAWAAHRSVVGGQANWTMMGRVAIQAGSEGWQAGLRWVQREDQYALRISAPMGQGTVQLDGGPMGVVMRTAEDEVLTAADPESLMVETLGWAVPVQGLQFWVRGIPEPGQPVEDLSLDASGRLLGMRQAGWEVSVEGYMRAEGMDLPQRVFLRNERFQVRVAVNRWRQDSP